MSVQLTHQQQAAVDNRGGELLVSAAAGSGKTRILVERLLNRAEETQENLDRFLVITYTKAAAAELREKVADALNTRLAERPNDAFLRRQKMVIYRAQISTIHSFCQALLREEGFRINLSADFRVGDEGECAILKQQVLTRLLEDSYAHMEGDNFSLLADTMSAGRDDSRLCQIVLDIHTRIQSHPDPAQWLSDQAKSFDLGDVKEVGSTRWGGLLMEDARRRVLYWRSRFVDALDLLREDPPLEAAYSESYDATLDSMDSFLSALDRGWDSARALCDIAFPKLGRAPKSADLELKERVQAMRNRCKQRLVKKLKQIFSDSCADLLAGMAAVQPVAETLLSLAEEFDRRYTEEKRRRNLVDFSDLEHLGLRLLEEEEVASRWRDRFVEVMVDEYQDTNEVQNAIFRAVSREGQNLFQVGDVKQSIYRFRLADPGIFLEKYDRFKDGAEAAAGEPRRLILSYNFRSRESVVDGVNFIFENILSSSFGELDYTDDQRLQAKLPYPPRERDAVELDAVDMAGLEREPGEAKVSRDAAEAEFVARRVRQLLDEGYPVTDRDGSRAVRPEDIAILYRSPGSVMRYLGRALDRHRIPWTGDGSGDFFAAEEVKTALAFLEIVDNPHQDVPLLAVLTCPVYRFSGDDLALLRADHPKGDLYDCLKDGADHGRQKCVRFLRELSTLRVQAPDVTGHELLWQIYESTGLLAVYGALDGGSVRQENLRLLHEYARQFEQNGHRGVFGLVTQLRRLRESGKGILAGGGQSGTGVQVMSIHRSKGLEFPVVILAGLNRGFNRIDQQAPVLFHPKLGIGPSGLDADLNLEFPTLARRAVALQLEREMKAEELRLLYVAMTRAREKLILVFACADLEKLVKKLAPDVGAHPDPEALNELGTVAEWMLLPILARPDAEMLQAGGGTGASLLSTEDRWDIRAVTAEKPEGGPHGKQRESGKENHLTDEEIRRLTWKNPRSFLADAPSKATATQMKGRALDAEAAEGTLLREENFTFSRPRFDRAERGLTANQIGTAVHTVMQLIRPECAADAQAVREEIFRLVDQESLTEQEAEAVNPEQIAAFFASPLGREAVAAPDLRREFKFSVLASASLLDSSLPEEEQVLLQGVIDCCFTGSVGLTVVDFKTDRVRPEELAEHSERYHTQLDVYTTALSRITGAPVQRRVLWYFRPGQGVEL